MKTAAPDAVVLDTPDNGAQTKAVITALVAAGFGGAKLWLTSQNLADYSQALPAGHADGVSGLLEGAESSAAFQAQLKAADPSVPRLPVRAGGVRRDDPRGARGDTGARRRGHPASPPSCARPSVGGIKCTSYAECLDVLMTEPAIDYDGVSGELNLDAAGDHLARSYGVYTYTADNKYARTGSVVG